MEGRAVVDFRLYPDSPSMAFYDLLAQRKPYTRPRVLASLMRPLEHSEYPLLVPGPDTSAVVGDGDLPVILCA